MRVKVNLSLVLALMVCSVSGWAQNVTTEMTLKEFLRMKDSIGQTPAYMVEALSPAIVLSRQSFQISDKKTGDLYGLNNHDEFGTEITLGVKVRGGLVLSDRAIRPWEYNSKFDTYKDNYNPVPFMSDLSETGEKAEYAPLDISKDKLTELAHDLLYLVKSENKGLETDHETGKKNGWIVWVTAKKDVDLNTSAKVDFLCYSKQLEVSKDCVPDLDAPNDCMVLGGIYVVPTITDIGVLEFRLCGVIQNADSRWTVIFPFAENKVDKTSEIEKNTAPRVKDAGGKDSLTPVEDDVYPVKMKKKKNKKK